MRNYGQSNLVSGLDDQGNPRTIKVSSDGTVQTSTVDFGTKITDSTMPTGGVGNLGWLSAIWKQLIDKLPALVGGKIPVDVASLSVTVDNANLEISNDAGNPIPISDAGGSITVDGSVSVSNFPVTQAISGTVTANTGLSQPLTDAQLRATPVPISGTITTSLPSGAATSANQSTTNATLSTINDKLPTLVGGKVPVDVGGLNVSISNTNLEISNDVSNPIPISQVATLIVDQQGELLEAIESLRMAVNSLTKTVGFIMPDVSGRARVIAENPNSSTLQATVTLAGNQTLSNLTNQTQIGGYSANDKVPALMNISAGVLRNSIIVT